MLTYTKLSNAWLFKIIQSRAFFGNMIGKIDNKELTQFAVPLAKDILPQFATKWTLSVIDKFERKTIGPGTVRIHFINLV